MAIAEPSRPFLELKYVRGILWTPLVFTNALAAEGALLDQLVESELLDNAAIRDAVKEGRSTSRKRQAQVLLSTIVEWSEWPVANFLFFLYARQPGLLNIIETGLLDRVGRALESEWNVVADRLEADTPSHRTRETEKKLQEFAEARENQRPINIVCE